ncbi:MAG: NMD protein affecting ribosome stability and mRNA decay [Desulforhopalus sp.]|jgi:NMD protein affecting ribosome stability and mRNA decay
MDKSQHGRRDRLIKEKQHDMYLQSKKWPEPTICKDCSAVYTEGRWTWYEEPSDANKVLCPACQRISTNYPAGYLALKGSFLQTHREEMFNLIRNEEKQEKSERPLERIMDIIDKESHTEITTTGIHVARRIGEAVSRAYKGELTFSYGDDEKSIRVFWER